jgi:manganese/zinc/iron transport system ATP- binding protein
MHTPVITLKDVSVGYPGRVVLADVNLRLERGTFTGLLGANGSGKSTLLKTIVGIYAPLLGNIDVHSEPGRTLTVGYIPQRESLDPVFLLSSFEVVLMGVCGRIGPGRRIDRAERAWALQCLGRMGAADLASRLFSQLSGGQKQRVLIARALAAKPDLLMLDEPTAGIDAGATRAIMELLRDLHQQQHQTILMVSHDLSTVRQYAQSVIWLHQGRVLHGPVSELLSRAKIDEILDLEFG